MICQEASESGLPGQLSAADEKMLIDSRNMVETNPLHSLRPCFPPPTAHHWTVQSCKTSVHCTPQLDGVGPGVLVLGFLGQHCRTVLAHESERPSTHLATSPINCQTSCIICSRYHGIFGLFSYQDLFPHFQFEDRHYHHSLGHEFFSSAHAIGPDPVPRAVSHRV